MFLLEPVLDFLPLLFSECAPNVSHGGELLVTFSAAVSLDHHLCSLIRPLISLNTYMPLYLVDLYLYSQLYKLFSSGDYVSCYPLAHSSRSMLQLPDRCLGVHTSLNLCLPYSD